MKKIILYFMIFAGAVMFSACEKFLELDPISELGASGFYKTDSEVDAGVVSIYAALMDIPDIEFALTEMRTDNTKTRTSEGDWAQFESMNVDPANVSVSSYWTTSYNIIYQANLMLQYIDVVEDETLKNQLLGEIYFLRGMTYFNMVRLYGGVPLVDEVVTPEDAAGMSERATEAAIYSFITTDLTNAVSLLQTRTNVVEGRATKAAAQTLLAKVYLTQKDFSSALPLLNAVIASTDYDLETNYEDVFYGNINENTEAIFAIQYIRGDANNSEEFSYAMTHLGRAGGLNWPTDDLISVVDTSLSDGDGDLRTPTLFSFNEKAGSSGDFACGKFLDKDNLQAAGNPWIVLRLADVYLMYCEAVLGNAASISDVTALGYINQIRSRADLTDLAEITPDNLLLERRVELSFENHRLFDLVRFGKADEILGAYALKAEAGFVYDTRDLLLPIPQRELAIYDMGQNPGY